MPVICPNVLATTIDDFSTQMKRVAKFAERIQIDLTDGDFAKNKTISVENAWWPNGAQVDIHLMYKNPEPAVNALVRYHPNMIIVHAESMGKFDSIISQCRERHIKVGLALLASSSPQMLLSIIQSIDHVLLFSGTLGEFGGQANLDLLRKVEFLRHEKSDIEIGWDGGINDRNISQLVTGGIDVLDVGGYIQNSPDPEKAFYTLKRIADETGTT